MEVTGTFKYTKGNLLRDGYDPAAAAGPVYFNDRQSGSYVPLEPELYGRIRNGQVRL